MTGKKIQLVSVVGARPNFMKAAPLIRQFQKHSDTVEHILIHTGQHYDHNLSRMFFDDLSMPDTDIYLGIGSGSHAEMTGKIMIALEKELQKLSPDLVIVYGDINSTLATAIVTSKLQLKLAHIEAGLRSFDNSMPEEINRIVTDRLSDMLFVTEQIGVDNLIKEGISEDKIYLVGNLMIDSLKASLPLVEKSSIVNKYNLETNKYAVLTLHRPGNVDRKDNLIKIVDVLLKLSEKLPIIFPCHPRTLKQLEQFSILSKLKGSHIKVTEPLGYIDFIALLKSSLLAISDSGGIQADASYLNVPCLTLRDRTEQPTTIDFGSNSLIGDNYELLNRYFDDISAGRYKKADLPPLWDGNAAERIADILINN